MNEYEYNGYVITETDDGYFVIGDFEFPTCGEAIEWVDQMNEPAVMHSYQIFYVTKNGYDDYEVVDAYTESEAKQKLRRKYPDIEYIPDCMRLD